eukprot:6108565-Amphidinium_carterae.1
MRSAKVWRELKLDLHTDRSGDPAVKLGPAERHLAIAEWGETDTASPGGNAHCVLEFGQARPSGVLILHVRAKGGAFK